MPPWYSGLVNSDFEKVDTVAFDLDGTLVDSHLDIANAVNDVLTLLGLPNQSTAAIRGMIGGGARKLLERALGKEPRLEEARAHFLEAYRARLLETTALYPGVAEFLQSLRSSGFHLLIATNKPKAFTEPLVAGLGLRNLGIKAIASADEVPIKKPDPGVVRLALQRGDLEGRNGQQLAYVGDMAVDIQTARARGCLAIGVVPSSQCSWGYDPEGVRRETPDAISDNPGKLGALLLGGC